MSWYQEQLAKARQRRFGAGRRYPRGRKFVAGDVDSAPPTTEKRPILHAVVRKRQQRDAQRRATQNALYDAILSADSADLDAELARLDRL